LAVAMMASAASAPALAAAGKERKAGAGKGASRGLRGSYELVRRVLPDGKEIVPPAIYGFATWTSTHRNFNVFWKDEAGKPVSVSTVATYTLSDTEYCEHPLFWLQNNLGTPGVSYEVPAAKSRCGSVSKDGVKLKVELPGEPPQLVLDGDSLEAHAEGQFTDYWQRSGNK
jgi:hypothetical protein